MSIYDKYIDNMTCELDFTKGSFQDQSGNNAVSVVGSPYLKNSERGRVYKGVGGISYIDAGSNITAAQTTMSIWFKTSNAAVEYMFQGKNGEPYFSIILVTNGIQFQTLAGSPQDNKIYPTYWDNKWHNLVCVRDGDDRADAKIYWDGVLQASAAAGNIGVAPTARFFGNATSNSFTGESTGAIVFNRALSAEDVAKLYEEYQTKQPYTAVDFKSKDRYINAVADGMMKKTGADDFIVDGVGGVLSKVADAERGQVLAVYSGAGNITYAYQYNLEVGYYRLRGWLKGDATNGGIARIKVGGVWMTGSNATDNWQMIDEVVYNPSAANVPFKMGQTAATTSYAYYSDIECIKLNSANENDFASPKGYIADGKGWNESLADVTSGFLTNTRWTVDSGTWAVQSADGFNKKLACIGTGRVSALNGQAYGTWEWDVYHAAGTDSRVYFIASSSIAHGSTGQSGYMLSILSTERIVLHRNNGDGSSSTMFQTDQDYVPENAWIRLRVTRKTNNEFITYFSLDSGLTWTEVVESSGSNPITDATYTTSTRVVSALGTSDATKSFKFIPYIQ